VQTPTSHWARAQGLGSPFARLRIFILEISLATLLSSLALLSSSGAWLSSLPVVFLFDTGVRLLMLLAPGAIQWMNFPFGPFSSSS
jgi:hypothetical protein